MRPGERIPLHDHRDRNSGGHITLSNIVTQVSGGESGTSATVPTASDVPISDIGGNFTATNVEAALAELATGSGPDVELETVAAAGATETIDVSVARTYDVTLTADLTLTLTGATTGEAWFVALFLRQDGTGGWDVTWPVSVEWASGTAPTIDPDPNAVTVVTLGTLDGGTVWYGFPTGGASGASALDDLADVNAPAPSDNDVLAWDDGTSMWVPVAPGASSIDVELVTVAAAGATETVDVSTARSWDVTLTADCTVTLDGAVDDEAWYLTLALRQDGVGGWEVTWPGSVVWPGGTPVLATDPGDIDWFLLATVDGGTTWYGFPTGSTGGTMVADLDDLTDVTITSPAEGHMIRYRSGEWVNETASASARWELVVTGSAPPVAMTNDAETDFLYAEV